MKHHHLLAFCSKSTAALFMAAVLACASTGCHSTGYKKANVASQGLQYGAAEVQTEAEALQSTMQALDNLVNQPGSDLRPQFMHFSRSLDWLNACAKRTDATGKRIQKNNTAYLVKWDKEMQGMSYDYIRASSETRRKEVAGHLQALDKRFVEAQSAVQPLIDYLEDIRRALSTDLTVGGLDAAKPIVAKASDNASKLDTALASLGAELNTSGTQISSYVPESKTPRVATPAPTGSPSGTPVAEPSTNPAPAPAPAPVTAPDPGPRAEAK
jgi:hypothetical protein